jgi:hypothetical protein
MWDYQETLRIHDHKNDIKNEPVEISTPQFPDCPMQTDPD